MIEMDLSLGCYLFLIVIKKRKVLLSPLIIESASLNFFSFPSLTMWINLFLSKFFLSDRPWTRRQLSALRASRSVVVGVWRDDLGADGDGDAY